MTISPKRFETFLSILTNGFWFPLISELLCGLFFSFLCIIQPPFVHYANKCLRYIFVLYQIFIKLPSFYEKNIKKK